MRRLLIGAALLIIVFLAWLGFEGWFYLQHGYSLEVRMAGRPGSIFHIGFPAWRAALHVLLSVAAIAAIGAYVAGRSRASAAAWLVLAATSAAGAYDVVQYGTMGSPTSVWTVLLLLLFALLARFAPLSAPVDT